MKQTILRLTFKALDWIEDYCDVVKENCNKASWKVKEWWWHGEMPSNVKINEDNLPTYCCPFCNHELDYRINYDGILCGVCWPCNKAWYETWDNSDCPMFDNCNWPTKSNALSEKPTAFWENALWHSYKCENGLMVVTGKVQRPK